MARRVGHTTPRLTSVATLAAVLALVGSERAWADAVPMPPDDDDCPNGARGETSHCGPHCQAWTCTDDSTCRDGRTCRQASLCVEEIECMSGYGTYTARIIASECDSAGGCARGTCELFQACARGTDPGSDASPTDAEPPDAAPTDAEPPDAAPTDAEPPDAAPTDAEPPDAAPADGAPPDTSPGDATPPDDSAADGGGYESRRWGCGCRANGSGSRTPPWALLGVGVLALRRRLQSG